MIKAIRLHYLAGFIGVVALLSTALFLQFYKGINPCPLCILQRCVMGVLGVIFLSGIMLPVYKRLHFFLNGLAAATALSGLCLSGRQVWLQFFPSINEGDCGANLSTLIQLLPLDEVAKEIWQGGMECSAVSWTWMHLSLAAWSCCVFVLLLFLIGMQIRRVAAL